MRFIRDFETLTLDDIADVGAKNASLGEMIRYLAPAGVRVPPGFALTADAYRAVLAGPHVRPRLRAALEGLDFRDAADVRSSGAAARHALLDAPFPQELLLELEAAYRTLSRKCGEDALRVAVRSSAIAEDLPDAAFAGRHESYLNVHGVAQLVDACGRCFASLFTDRAIHHRAEHGVDHERVFLSVGVQQMVRADRAGSGLLSTLDPETGFEGAVLLTASYGLGANRGHGANGTDDHVVFKATKKEVSRSLGSKEAARVHDEDGAGGTRSAPVPESMRQRFVLSPGEVEELARQAVAIEEHYSERAGRYCPVEIEWAKDGDEGSLLVVQVQPETTQARRDPSKLVTWSLQERGPVRASGRAIGRRIGAGPVHRLTTAAEPGRFRPGSVLVTAMTDPDWEPILRKAAAVVTDQGGAKCHAAIASRALGLPCVVGTGNASAVLQDGEPVTVSCAEGDIGLVFEGRLACEQKEIDVHQLPRTRTRIHLNLDDPGQAFALSCLPVDGVGPVRVELIVASTIGVHPMALLHPERTDDATRREIARKIHGHRDGASFFQEQLASGVARIAMAFHPRPVVVRLSDFKTDECGGLLGGRFFEAEEGNPTLGFRGASRYAHPAYREAFALECLALGRVRRDMGLTNVSVMIPFCRTVDEAARVQAEMARHGLGRGVHGLRVLAMCETPANVLLMDDFAKHFDGFAIGSNELTQLILGVDADSVPLASYFDERNKAVVRAFELAIEAAHRAGRTIGFYGQASSGHPELTTRLVRAGIDSLSLPADLAIAARIQVADIEARLEAPRPAGPA